MYTLPKTWLGLSLLFPCLVPCCLFGFPVSCPITTILSSFDCLFRGYGRCAFDARLSRAKGSNARAWSGQVMGKVKESNGAGHSEPKQFKANAVRRPFTSSSVKRSACRLPLRTAGWFASPKRGPAPDEASPPARNPMALEVSNSGEMERVPKCEL